MPTRRVVLAAALGAGVSACLPGQGAPRRRPARPDRDGAVRARASAGELALLSAYDVVLAARPDLSARLAPLRAHHAAHLAAIGAASTSSPTPHVRPPDLVALERRAADDRLADCLAASDPALARLLASVGACEAGHAALLATPPLPPSRRAP